MDRVRFAAFAVIALVPPLMSVPASAAPADDSARPAVVSDIRELDRTHFTLDGKALPGHPRYHPHRRAEGRAAAATPPIGTQRKWLGLDDTTGKYYPKTYKLRAVGKHIEVWVADDLAFPKNDCRKNALDVTDAEIAQLIKEFDDNIYPKETAAFSTPPTLVHALVNSWVRSVGTLPSAPMPICPEQSNRSPDRTACEKW